MSDADDAADAGFYEPPHPDYQVRPLAPGECTAWRTVLTPEGGASYESIRGKDCEISLEMRPHYCDRGRYSAKLFAYGDLGRQIDYADGWMPCRYYFDHERAVLEVEAWLRFRGQWVRPEGVMPGGTR